MVPSILRMHAAAESEVAGMLGVGDRDPALAHALLGRTVEVAPEDPDDEGPGVDETARTLLWRPDALRPLGDAAWRAVEAAVMVAARLDLAPAECAAARHLDDLFAELDVPAEAGPLALARPPRLGVDLPAPRDVYVRVVPHEAARGLWRLWLLAEPGDHDDLTTFARDFLALADEPGDRALPDLWLVAPARAPQVPRLPGAPWPPPPVDWGPVGPRLGTFLPGAPTR